MAFSLTKKQGTKTMAADDSIIGVAKQETPLLRKLSPELRSMIYELVLVSSETVELGTQEQQPGLTQTCREIRTECLSMFYARNTFRFLTKTGGNDGLDPIATWLDRIGRTNCLSLRSLHIAIAVRDGCMMPHPREKNNPWQSLVLQMKTCGCSKAITLAVAVHESVKPSEEELDERRRRLGSAALADLLIQNAREVFLQFMRVYCKLLLVQHLRPNPVFCELLEQQGGSFDDMVDAVKTAT